MARHTPDGDSRLVFVPAGGLADPAAAAATELNAGTVIDITPSAIDWTFPESGSTADSADMSSAFNKQDIGTYGGDTGTINCYYDDTANTVWAALPRGTRGFFVERESGGASAAFAAADVVKIYGAGVTARSPQQRTRNTMLMFTVTAALTAEPVHDVVVAV